MSQHPLNDTQIEYSTYSVPGERRYMEDEFYVSSDGTFAAVFDGHGGKAVSRCVPCRSVYFTSVQSKSIEQILIIDLVNIMLFQRYLRQNLYANFQAALGIDMTHEVPESVISSALHSTFNKVDLEVQNVVHWSFQGTCKYSVLSIQILWLNLWL